MSVGFDGPLGPRIPIVHLVRCSRVQAWLWDMSRHLPVAFIFNSNGYESDIQWLRDLEVEATAHPDHLYVPTPLEEQ